MANAGRFLLGAPIAFLVIASVTAEPILTQLVVPHHRVSGAYDASQFDGLFHLASELSARLPAFVLVLFAIGMLVAFGKITMVRILPLLWLASACLVLGLHRPYFSHQLILIYPAIAWIAALYINVVNGKVRVAAAIAGLLFLAAIAVTGAYEQRAPKFGYRAGFAEWLAQAPSDAWVLSDVAMDAYRAGRLVPPELAVWSAKRIIAGYLPADALIDIVEDRRPERILLRRFHQPREFLDYLAAHYTSVTTMPWAKLNHGKDDPPIYQFIRKGDEWGLEARNKDQPLISLPGELAYSSNRLAAALAINSAAVCVALWEPIPLMVVPQTHSSAVQKVRRKESLVAGMFGNPSYRATGVFAGSGMHH